MNRSEEEWPSAEDVLNAQARFKTLHVRVMGAARLLSLVYETVTRKSGGNSGSIPWNLLDFYSMKTTARILGVWRFFCDGMDLIRRYGTVEMEDRNQAINSRSDMALLVFGPNATRAQRENFYDSLKLTKIPLMIIKDGQVNLEPEVMAQYRHITVFRYESQHLTTPREGFIYSPIRHSGVEFEGFVDQYQITDHQTMIRYPEMMEDFRMNFENGIKSMGQPMGHMFSKIKDNSLYFDEFQCGLKLHHLSLCHIWFGTEQIIYRD